MPPSYGIPSATELENKTMEVFKRRPCKFQVEVALSLLRRDYTILIAPTGAGKTLPLWIPILFNGDGIIIVITALNVLGSQNQRELEAAGIKAVSITAANASPSLYKAISEGEYRVIIIPPERAKSDPAFQKVWSYKKLMSRLFCIIVDEAHCINQWGSTFRPEYSRLGDLQFIVPPGIHWCATTATITPPELRQLQKTLNMPPKRTTVIQLSNDRPNIALIVQKMQHAANSYKDLAFLIPAEASDTHPPPPFLVFFNTRYKAEAGAHFLRKQLSKTTREKVMWFHSGMSEEFKVETIQKLNEGIIWGLCCTDAAGMGLDIPHIKIAVQYGACELLATLLQRVGRAGRNNDIQAFGILIVESKFLKKSGSEIKSGATRTGLHESAQGQDTDSEDSGEETEVIPKVTVEKELEAHKNVTGQRGYEYSKTRTGKRRHGIARGHGRQAFEMEGAMEKYIKPETAGFKCRRKVLNEHFGNNKIKSNYASCCSRCAKRVREPMICCDLCTPDAIKFLFETDGVAITRKRRKRKVDTLLLDETGKRLKKAIDLWRKRKLEGLFEGQATRWGPNMVLTDSLAERILGLAIKRLIPDLSSLETQVDWAFTRKYGAELLELVHKHIPTCETVPKPTVLKGRCSACNLLGHRCNNRWVCKRNPNYMKFIPNKSQKANGPPATSLNLQNAALRNKENVPPSLQGDIPKVNTQYSYPSYLMLPTPQHADSYLPHAIPAQFVRPPIPPWSFYGTSSKVLTQSHPPVM